LIDGFLAENGVPTECISEYENVIYIFSPLASRLDPALYGGEGRFSSSRKEKDKKFRRSGEGTKPTEIEHRLSPVAFLTILHRQNPNRRVFISVAWKENGRIRVIAAGAGVPESWYIIAMII
jgi:hypothetical protein